jgi:hypothetical protein
MLQNSWDEVVRHVLVRCELCSEVVYTSVLKDGLEARLREMTEPLCPRHKLEKQAGALLSGKLQLSGSAAP